MSRHDADFERFGRPALFSYQGRLVDYVDPMADPVEITAVVSEADAKQRAEDGDRTVVRRRNVTIGRDPLSTDGGIAAPRAEANGKPVYFVIDGEIWTIESLALTATKATCVCIQTGTVEFARDQYRRTP